MDASDWAIYIVDDDKLEELQKEWHSTNLKLICATDGGLKDGIGISSYAFFRLHDTDPIIPGSAVEHQPHITASSTNQELLGQLAVEYWLQKMQNEWDTTRQRPSLLLITDNQARIDIQKASETIVGIRDTMNPEIDVVLEINAQQSRNWWITRETKKFVAI